MAYEFKFPDVGEGITEGEVVKWLVKEGDAIKEHQPVAEVETDKAIVEMPSPRGGTVLRIHHQVGETVKVGEVLLTIGEQGEKITAPQAITAPPVSVPSTQEKGVAVVGELPTSPEALFGVIATPATRALAKSLGVDINLVRGTGPGGRITDDDVKGAAKPAPVKAPPAQAPAPAPAAAPAVKITKKYDIWGYVERVPLRGVRKAVAKKMSESWANAVHVSHMAEADVTHLYEIREREKDKAAAKGIHLTYLPFIIRAAVAALKEHPYLNAVLEGEEIILKKYYNIGIATDTPDGLMVPVIKVVQDKKLLEIAQEIEKLSAAARERKIDLADLKGGTFTITNVGGLGGIFATPIINYPEVAILATGKIADAPRVINGKIEIRKMMGVSLTFDHRVLDGAEAAKFTNDLIALLEDPDRLLVEL